MFQGKQERLPTKHNDLPVWGFLPNLIDACTVALPSLPLLPINDSKEFSEPVSP